MCIVQPLHGFIAAYMLGWKQKRTKEEDERGLRQRHLHIGKQWDQISK